MIANLKESRTGIDIESIEADLQKANVEKSAIDAEYSAILEEYGRTSSAAAKLDDEIARHAESIIRNAKDAESLAVEKDTLTEKITAFDVQLKDQNKILVEMREGEQRLIEGQGGSTTDLEAYDQRTQEMRKKESGFADSKTKAITTLRCKDD